jgi:hypothetical protein
MATITLETNKNLKAHTSFLINLDISFCFCILSSKFGFPISPLCFPIKKMIFFEINMNYLYSKLQKC